MKFILKQIEEAKEKGEKLLAILLDPDKLDTKKVPAIIDKISKSKINFIFVGGSTVKNGVTREFVKEIKRYTEIPIVLFPGDHNQITNFADGILFLSLLSGRNPEYLIEQQIKSVSILQKSDLEIIPTGYILIDGGKETAVQKVSKTQPIAQHKEEEIVQTACAGVYLGKKLIYLEAGSGAKNPVQPEIIDSVKTRIDIPLIVGGGIRSRDQLEQAYKNGADLVVIGTAFEENNSVLIKILKNENIN